MASRFGRKRRKPRVVWLPPEGTIIHSSLVPGDQYGGDFFIGQLLLGANHNPTVEFPLVVDNVDRTALAGTFADWQGSSLALANDVGYRLRRIVGKIHIGVGSTTVAVPPTKSQAILATAAIIVRRTNTAGFALATASELSTQTISNWRDPWIFRRSWFLGTGTFALANDIHNALDVFPKNNVTGYGGGNADSAHVDQKTARRLGPEERLFLDVSFITSLQLDGQDETEESVNIAIHHDLRCLGTLSMNSGNRRNASR